MSVFSFGGLPVAQATGHAIVNPWLADYRGRFLKECNQGDPGVPSEELQKLRDQIQQLQGEKQQLQGEKELLQTGEGCEFYEERIAQLENELRQTDEEAARIDAQEKGQYAEKIAELEALQAENARLDEELRARSRAVVAQGGPPSSGGDEIVEVQKMNAKLQLEVEQLKRALNERAVDEREAAGEETAADRDARWDEALRAMFDWLIAKKENRMEPNIRDRWLVSVAKLSEEQFTEYLTLVQRVSGRSNPASPEDYNRLGIGRLLESAIFQGLLATELQAFSFLVALFETYESKDRDTRIQTAEAGPKKRAEEQRKVEAKRKLTEREGEKQAVALALEAKRKQENEAVYEEWLPVWVALYNGDDAIPQDSSMYARWNKLQGGAPTQARQVLWLLVARDRFFDRPEPDLKTLQAGQIRPTFDMTLSKPELMGLLHVVEHPDMWGVRWINQWFPVDDRTGERALHGSARTWIPMLTLQLKERLLRLGDQADEQYAGWVSNLKASVPRRMDPGNQARPADDAAPQSPVPEPRPPRRPGPIGPATAPGDDPAARDQVDVTPRRLFPGGPAPATPPATPPAPKPRLFRRQDALTLDDLQVLKRLGLMELKEGLRGLRGDSDSGDSFTTNDSAPDSPQPQFFKPGRKLNEKELDVLRGLGLIELKEGLRALRQDSSSGDSFSSVSTTDRFAGRAVPTLFVRWRAGR